VPPVPRGAAKKELKELMHNILSSQAVLRLARRWTKTELSSEDAAAIQESQERVVVGFLKFLRKYDIKRFVVDVFSNGKSDWMKFVFTDDREVNIFYCELPRYAEYLLVNIARFLHETCQYAHLYDKRLLRSVVEFMACSEAYGVDKITVVLRQRKVSRAGGVMEE